MEYGIQMYVLTHLFVDMYCLQARNTSVGGRQEIYQEPAKDRRSLYAQFKNFKIKLIPRESIRYNQPHIYAMVPKLGLPSHSHTCAVTYGVLYIQLPFSILK